MQLVNGESQNQLSIDDRGLLYGQSLFETLVVEGGKPLLLTRHLQRLERGCEVLGIPFQEEVLIEEITKVASGADRAVLRVTISMGLGKQSERGYINPVEPSPTRIISAYPFPDIPTEYFSEGIILGVAKIRLASQPRLAGLKHGNRLEQVIARSEWQSDWQEALLLDQHDAVIEGTQSNLFIREDNILSTPKLDQCGVQGVMRDFVLEHADKLGYASQERTLNLQQVKRADEVFLSNSVVGVWPVKQLQKIEFNNFSASRKTQKLLREHGAVSAI